MTLSCYHENNRAACCGRFDSICSDTVSFAGLFHKIGKVHVGKKKSCSLNNIHILLVLHYTNVHCGQSIERAPWKYSSKTETILSWEIIICHKLYVLLRFITRYEQSETLTNSFL